MAIILERQKSAHIRDGAPTLEVRAARLDRCVNLLIRHETEVVSALDQDFGSRAAGVSGIADIASSLGSLKHARAHLKAWMKPERRKTTPAMLALLGAKVEVRCQPKGTVGIISPWNFPVNLTFAPLAGVLAAGNRAMIKPSELTPATSALMARMFANAFDEEEIAVFPGGPDIGQAFCNLAFDHLMFTGATAIGRQVMRAAARNLVPVTLELGGKSPVILGRSADLPTATKRIMTGKTLNAGQVCLAPDYVLAPHDKLDSFVAEARLAVGTMFPTIKDNPDYTALINEKHFERLKSYVEDAHFKGAEIIEINPAGEDFSQQEYRKIPPMLILNAREDMLVMQEEIFGPVLPIMTYETVADAIAYVNAHDRPLGLYYFGLDADEEDKVLNLTTSGGVTVNDVIFHISQENLPFGGVGSSGLGSYHGIDGFREFSHRKSVYRQVGRDLGPLKVIRPPYGKGVVRYMAHALKG